MKDELVYGVSLDWDKMGFSSLNASIDKSIKAFTVATAVIASASAAVFAMGKNYAQTTDELIKTSQRINATTQEIQKLTFAAEDNGATMSDVTSSLESLAKAKEQMLRGSGDFEAWGRLGVNPAEYESTSDLLLDIADRVKDLDSQQAIDLMSRVGISPNMLQTLQNGKQGLKDLGLEAEALGMISTNRMLKSSQDFMAGWQRASSRVKGILDQVSANVLESTINPAIEAFNQFMSKNMKEISRILTKIIEYLTKAAQAVFAVFHTVYIQFERLSNMLGGMEEAVKLLGAVFVALKAKMIMSMLPAILVIGALYLAVDEFLSFMEGKESFLADFFDGIGVGAEEARGYIQAIGNPLERMIELVGMAIEGWKNLFGWIGYAYDKLESFDTNMRDTLNIPTLGEIVSGASSLFGNGNEPTAAAQTTNNSQIAINVNGAGDPVAVSQEVKRVLNEEMNKSAQRGGF